MTDGARTPAPHHPWRRTALAAGLCALIACGTRTQAAEAQADLWNAGGSHARVLDGTLTITPPDENWGRAATLSRSQVPFWNADGAVVKVRIAADTKKPGELFDNLMVVGFVSSSAARTMQGTSDFVGVHITYSKAKRTYGVYCGRKEAKGDPATRTENGESIPYAKGARLEVRAADEGFDLTISINQDRIQASVTGAGEVSYPLGLTRDAWQTPYLFAQTMNFNGGRAAMSIAQATVSSVASRLTAISALDLRPVANMGFRDEVADDRKGGWTDQGDNDLSGLATGPAVLQNIPFTIIDPASNGGKGMVVLQAKSRPFLPSTIGPIAVKRTVDSLVFLQTAAWSWQAGALAATYTASYEDGSRVDIPIRVGAHLNDWWSLKQVADPGATLITQVPSAKSPTGKVGLYGYRWRNPAPQKPIASLSLASAGGDVVYGLIAIAAVGTDIGGDAEKVLAGSFDKKIAEDPRRNPPDRELIPDRIVLRSEKAIGQDAISTPVEGLGGGFGVRAVQLPGYKEFVDDYGGGVSRFPHGNTISNWLWPYKATEWAPIVAAKGGRYGQIANWFMKYDCAPLAISHQEMLAAYKKNGLKLILTFNTSSMFDGKEFHYVKTMSEERLRGDEDTMRVGTFSHENLAKVVASNATLVDYIIQNGYLDTIAYWEMDNERYQVPGAEYAEMAAAHVRMLRAKVPTAKVILCFGDSAYSGYSAEPEKQGLAPWSLALLRRLKELGMADSIDYFAPHLYPFIVDPAADLIQNFLEDWGIRNVYRSLDWYGAMLDREGFAKSRFYVTEWGTQVDALQTNLNATMAAGVATAKEMMAIYSHPRVDGACWHQFTHQSSFGRESKQVLKVYGVQSVYTEDTGRIVTTPPAEAVKLFQRFAKGNTLVQDAREGTSGLHVLSARKADGGIWHYAVNTTASPIAFPGTGVSKRTTLTAPSVTSVSILRFGGYGDTPGEIDEILPTDAADTVLPPFSVSLVQ